MTIRPFLFLLLFVFASGCQLSKQLQVHQTELDRLAYDVETEREKFDGLAEVLVRVLDEASALNSSVRTARYVGKFSRQNEQSLAKLADDLEGWIQGMGPGKKIAFATRALAQPYSRKLVVLVPRIQKKAKEKGYSFGQLDRILLLFNLKKLAQRNKDE